MTLSILSEINKDTTTLAVNALLNTFNSIRDQQIQLALNLHKLARLSILSEINFFETSS